MNRKLVYRYYCDFCKKATCSASATSRHETACTMNPNRECRMCKAAEKEQPQLSQLLAAALIDILTTPLIEDDGLGKLVRPERLLAAADGCPACVLTGIRQLPPDDSVHFDWDFKEASKEFWNAVNDANN